MSKFQEKKKGPVDEDIGDAYDFHKTLKTKLNNQFYDETEMARDRETQQRRNDATLTDQLSDAFTRQVENDKSRRMVVNPEGMQVV